MAFKDYLLGAMIVIVIAAVTVTVVVVLRYERHPHPQTRISASELRACEENLGNGGC